ncbi:MAG: response regulator transcription factor [Paludibacteraceae bacterium]|nr:response regulator transcription factor [Paludibacteraceae bacterium]
MRSENKNIIIVEPSDIIRLGVRSMLQRIGYTIIAEADSAAQFAKAIQNIDADVLIVNPELVDEPRSFLRQMPVGENMPIVALVYQYFAPNKLEGYNAVIDIRANEESVSNVLTQLQSHRQTVEQSDYELTEREKEVLVLVAKGLMSKEIADKLNISIHTVITHRKNITRKTGIKSVAGLAVYAMLNNMIDNNER